VSLPHSGLQPAKPDAAGLTPALRKADEIASQQREAGRLGRGGSPASRNKLGISASHHDTREYRIAGVTLSNTPPAGSAVAAAGRQCAGSPRKRAGIGALPHRLCKVKDIWLAPRACRPTRHISEALRKKDDAFRPLTSSSACPASRAHPPCYSGNGRNPRQPKTVLGSGPQEPIDNLERVALNPHREAPKEKRCESRMPAPPEPTSAVGLRKTNIIGQRKNRRARPFVPRRARE
jgi:hypothetical protein